MAGLKATLLFCLFSLLPVYSQTGPNNAEETSPKVEQLYGEAKQAQSSGDLNAAIAKYEEILKLDPQLGPAYNNLGALYFRQLNFRRAADVLEQGLRVDPSMTTANALLGISLFKAAEYKEARPHLESALKANPNDANLQMFFVKNEIKLADYGAAISALERMAARQPKNQEIFYLLAQVYMKKSEQALAQMNAIDPNSVLSHQLSAEVMEGMNNYDGAVVELKKAVEMAPQLAGNHYLLGNAYWALSSWDQASEQFQAELKVDPTNCQAQAKLGDILLQKNDADQALDLLDKALQKCPALTDARTDRAKALVKLNRAPEALTDLEAAAQSTPDDPGVHFLLAKVYRATGRTQDAGREMQLFSKLDEAQRAATAERAQQVIQNKQTAH